MNISESNVSVKVVTLLRDIGIPANLLGYEYSKHALMILLDNPNKVYHMTKSVYPEVAMQCKTTPSRVERAIRHAVEVMFNRVDPDVYESRFGNTVRMDKGKLTNSEFLGCLAEHLRIEMGVYRGEGKQ